MEINKKETALIQALCWYFLGEEKKFCFTKEATEILSTLHKKSEENYDGKVLRVWE